MTEQWQELKETITDLRDNDGTGTQQEVSKFLLNLMDVLEKKMSSSEKPSQWIPCSERLPKGTAIVTAETKMFKYKYVCEAVWIPRWSKKAEYDSWEDCSEYNEAEDEHYVLEGWYERVHNWDEYSYVGIEDEVIAWMPLPEPYKGEES